MARKRDRVFLGSLAVSVVFHLSAVTIFSIVITFPRDPVDYYSLRFVDAATREPIFRSDEPWHPRQTDAPALRVPTFEDTLPALDTELPLDDPLQLAGRDRPLINDSLSLNPNPDLPPIDIPRLEFAELARLELRGESLRIRSGYDAEDEAEPRDSWAWFGRELGELRNSLRRLPQGLGGRPDVREDRVPVSTPLPGLEAYIEWMAEPTDRQLLFSPPIEALMGARTSARTQPITLVFKVNPQGRVIEVVDPVDDPDGIAASVVKALIKYRFSPIESESGPQYGTLVIVPSSPSP
jgi:hypothetical protein